MVHVRGYLPQLLGTGYQNSDGIGGGHYYIPRFNHRSKQDYLRGFGIQMWNTGSGTIGGDGRARRCRLRQRAQGRSATRRYCRSIPLRDLAALGESDDGRRTAVRIATACRS